MCLHHRTYKMNQGADGSEFNLARIVHLQNLLESIYSTWNDLLPIEADHIDDSALSEQKWGDSDNYSSGICNEFSNDMLLTEMVDDIEKMDEAVDGAESSVNDTTEASDMQTEDKEDVATSIQNVTEANNSHEAAQVNLLDSAIPQNDTAPSVEMPSLPELSDKPMISEPVSSTVEYAEPSTLNSSTSPAAEIISVPSVSDAVASSTAYITSSGPDFSSALSTVEVLTVPTVGEAGATVKECTTSSTPDSSSLSVENTFAAPSVSEVFAPSNECSPLSLRMDSSVLPSSDLSTVSKVYTVAAPSTECSQTASTPSLSSLYSEKTFVAPTVSKLIAPAAEHALSKPTLESSAVHPENISAALMSKKVELDSSVSLSNPKIATSAPHRKNLPVTPPGTVSKSERPSDSILASAGRVSPTAPPVVVSSRIKSHSRKAGLKSKFSHIANRIKNLFGVISTQDNSHRSSIPVPFDENTYPTSMQPPLNHSSRTELLKSPGRKRNQHASDSDTNLAWERQLQIALEYQQTPHKRSPTVTGQYLYLEILQDASEVSAVEDVSVSHMNGAGNDGVLSETLDPILRMDKEFTEFVTLSELILSSPGVFTDYEDLAIVPPEKVKSRSQSLPTSSPVTDRQWLVTAPPRVSSITTRPESFSDTVLGSFNSRRVSSAAAIGVPSKKKGTSTGCGYEGKTERDNSVSLAPSFMEEVLSALDFQ